MISEGWLSKLATIITIIIMLIFTGLCCFWKIDFFSWIVISTGGSITIWWIILLIADAIRILINFIKNNKI